MVTNPNVKTAVRLPYPDKIDVQSPENLQAYLTAVIRAIEQSFKNIDTPNNTPWFISGATNVSETSLSIAANTVSQAKIRDNFLTLLYVLKNTRKIN